VSARSETLEGVDEEARAWLGSHLDVFARKYAHELAEKIRADKCGSTSPDDVLCPCSAGAADLIDPEVTS